MAIVATILGHDFSQCCSVLFELSTSELVEFLQNSVVEHLITYRQLEARHFGSVFTIVTTDFEAMYAYKRGDYQRCLQLSTQNVHTLLDEVSLTSIPIFLPEFIQLLDDDIVSMLALMLMINRECRYDNYYSSINQLNQSVYLMTQCQLKLCHSKKSLTQTLEYIKVSQRRCSRKGFLNHLTLKLIERKATERLRLKTDCTVHINTSTVPCTVALNQFSPSFRKIELKISTQNRQLAYKNLCALHVDFTS